MTTVRGITADLDAETQGFKSFRSRMKEGILEYSGGQIIGRGHNTVVLPGTLRHRRKLTRRVAIKYAKTEDIAEAKRLETELSILAGMQEHRNIIKFYGGKTLSYEGSKQGQFVVLIAMELMDYNLLHLFFENEKFAEKCTFTNFLNIFVKIATGLELLHQDGIVHHDLKSANILVSSEGRVVKIADFGASKVLTCERDSLTYSCRGTEYYMAPEVRQEKSYGKASDLDLCKKDLPRITREVDIFSLGCVMWECLNMQKVEERKLPERLSGRNIKWAALGRTNQVWCNGPLELCDLIEECLVYSPEALKGKAKHRPSATEIRESLEAMLKANWVKCKVKGYKG